MSKFDQRRHYITGFTGSAGIAVVTDQVAALWTDGRYFLQADMELDCNWILMKSGQDDVIEFISYFLKLDFFFSNYILAEYCEFY